MGGESLQAIRIGARVQETFGVELGLGILLSAQTARMMAGIIEWAMTKPGPPLV
ncbi:MAG: acyl carrier protein [Acidimicrobiia bacterium]